MQILIKGGRVVDPGKIDGIADIFIEDGKIVEIREGKGTKAEGRRQKGKGLAESGATSNDPSSPSASGFASQLRPDKTPRQTEGLVLRSRRRSRKSDQ